MTEHKFKKDIENKGLKISYLAQKVGISQPLLSMYLSGKRKMPFNIEFKLAKELS
jgi:transcriptional regulator with XRE-family HTH domain